MMKFKCTMNQNNNCVNDDENGENRISFSYFLFSAFEWKNFLQILIHFNDRKNIRYKMKERNFLSWFFRFCVWNFFVCSFLTVYERFWMRLQQKNWRRWLSHKFRERKEREKRKLNKHTQHAVAIDCNFQARDRLLLNYVSLTPLLILWTSFLSNLDGKNIEDDTQTEFSIWCEFFSSERRQECLKKKLLWRLMFTLSFSFDILCLSFVRSSHESEW